jgi:hypothetical protein
MCAKNGQPFNRMMTTDAHAVKKLKTQANTIKPFLGNVRIFLRQLIVIFKDLNYAQK